MTWIVSWQGYHYTIAIPSRWNDLSHLPRKVIIPDGQKAFNTKSEAIKFVQESKHRIIVVWEIDL